MYDAQSRSIFARMDYSPTSAVCDQWAYSIMSVLQFICNASVLVDFSCNPVLRSISVIINLGNTSSVFTSECFSFVWLALGKARKGSILFDQFIHRLNPFNHEIPVYLKKI